MIGYIYKITNLINNKSYIGQTIEKNPFVRINYHFKKYDKQKLVYNSANKYGIDNFKKEIIFIVFDKKDLNFYEEYFIEYFNTIKPNGFNIMAGGQKHKMTDEIRKKIGNSMKGLLKGIPKSEEHKKNMSLSRKGFTSPNRLLAAKKRAELKKKKVKAFNLLTKEQLIFPSVTEASLSLSVVQSNICRVCNKKQNRTQAGGWTFVYI